MRSTTGPAVAVVVPDVDVELLLDVVSLEELVVAVTDVLVVTVLLVVLRVAV